MDKRNANFVYGKFGKTGSAKFNFKMTHARRNFEDYVTLSWTIASKQDTAISWLYIAGVFRGMGYITEDLETFDDCRFLSALALLRVGL